MLTEAKRRLRVLEFDLGEKIIDDHERDNATKYHKVKHFGKEGSVFYEMLLSVYSCNVER